MTVIVGRMSSLTRRFGASGSEIRAREPAIKSATTELTEFD